MTNKVYIVIHRYYEDGVEGRQIESVWADPVSAQDETILIIKLKPDPKRWEWVIRYNGFHSKYGPEEFYEIEEHEVRQRGMLHGEVEVDDDSKTKPSGNN